MSNFHVFSCCIHIYEGFINDSVSVDDLLFTLIASIIILGRGSWIQDSSILDPGYPKCIHYIPKHTFNIPTHTYKASNVHIELSRTRT